MPRPHEATLDLPQVHKPPMEPGSILFFHSILHGTTAWLSPWERRAEGDRQREHPPEADLDR